MKKNLIAVAVSSCLIPSAFASVVFNDTITYINGSGNPNTGWVSDTSNDILLGIRADNRSTGATPNNGAGTYTFQPGLVSGKADWNFQFTINSDATSGVTSLSTYDYFITLSVNGVAFGGPANVLQSFPDMTYGDDSSTQGHNVTVGDKPFDATDVLLGLTKNVAANSESITFLGLPNNGGVYQFDLYAVAAGAGANGTKLDDVSMTVVVPEAQTYWAGALLMLPLGLVALRKARKNRTA